MNPATRFSALNRYPDLAWILPAGALAVAVGLSLLISPLVAAAALFIGAFGIALFTRPWIGYALLLASVPVQQLGVAGDGPSPVTLTQLAFPVALVAFGIHVLVRRRPLRRHIVLAPLAALLLVQLASALNAEDGRAALAELARWSVAALALLVALQFLQGASERRITTLVIVLALGGVFEAGFGVVQSVLALGPFQLESGVSRAFGTFGKPNSYAGYLEMTLFPALWLGVWYLSRLPGQARQYWLERGAGFVASAPERKRLLATTLLAIALIAMAGFILFGIIASLSRGAWLGVAVAAVATALLYGRLTRFVTLLAVGVVAITVLGGVAGIFPETVRERVATVGVNELGIVDASSATVTDENYATVERIAHWQAGWRMFTDAPMLGVGVGNFNARYEDYYVNEAFRFSQGHAHNYYIHTLAETGLVGLLVYLTVVFGILVLGALTILRGPTEFGRVIALAAFGSLLAVTVHNLFENLHVLNLGIVIGFLWALVIAGHEHSVRERRSTW